MDDSAVAVAEPRKGCVDVFNEFMLDCATLAGYYKIPRIERTPPPRGWCPSRRS